MIKRITNFYSRYKLVLISFFIIIIPSVVTPQIPAPNINIGIGQATNPSQISLSLQVLILITILSLAPAIVIMTTSFIRLAIVFSFVRTALGTQNLPPNQVLMALAVFLTIFIMAPTIDRVYKEAWQPYSQGKEGTFEDLYNKGITPVREFMFKQLSGPNSSRGMDTLFFFIKLAGLKERPKNESDVPTHILIPAFMTHELRKSFEIGIKIFIPFLMIDLIVASILMAMGMIMLPPVMIALPFKLILFVLVDGWNLIIKEMVESFVK
ncbi:MAG TPA: flagellar type III secretion system pore protein FliP [Spirochaetota bacterium]|nr:flagellar type III secretion system pore protein FliP [Spirochaetota bacterium]HOM38656.1 flagellar type III secretion system pore protein FliP [Spirochaetota bacterium]HPQ49828.1 flagellar type III secretion system pore protein FliP [Spirochaetota bacterium]